MPFDDGRPRLQGAKPAGAGLLGRLFGVVFGIAALILTLTVSVFVFAAVLVIGAIAFGYFWWKTRDVRRQMRAMREQYARGGFDGMPGGFPGGFPGGAGRRPDDAQGRGNPGGTGGRVIDGEAVREDEPPR